MRFRGIVLSLSAALLLSPLGVARADEVVVGLQGTAATHNAGFPTTSEPWRSLTSATFTSDAVRGEWTGTATLAGPAPAGTKVTVGWALGRQHPNGCEVLAQYSEDFVVTGDTVRVDRDYERPTPDLGGDRTCLSVVLATTDTDGTVRTTDWITGPLTSRTDTSALEAAPAAGRFVVAAGRTTPAIVLVRSHLMPSAGATVTGTGRGVSVAETPEVAVGADRAVPVVVRVAARRPGTSSLRLAARDGRDSRALDADWAVVARTIEARRPLPGRYATGDGRVRFRVSADHHVRNLRVQDVSCPGTNLTYDVRLPGDLRLPRSGALARVVTIEDELRGDTYYATQLLTTSKRRVTGTFAVSTHRCAGSMRFSAVRQG